MRRTAVPTLIAALAAAAALGAPSAAFAFAEPDASAGRTAPPLDVRAGERAPLPADVQAARADLAQELGVEGVVATEPRSGGVRAIARSDGFLTDPSGADAADVALGYVADHPDVFGLDAGARAELRLIGRYASDDGVVHLTWLQTSAGIASFDNVLNANVTADGRLLSIGGDVVPALDVPTATPALTASQALAGARTGIGAAPGFPAAQTDGDRARTTTFANGDDARLVVFAAPGGDRLAWRVTVAGAAPYRYDVVVDAISGSAVLADLATDPTWLNASASSTRLDGRNAWAYADVGGGDGHDAGEDVPARSGSDWLYPLTSTGAAAGQQCSAFSGICSWDGASLATEPTNRRQTTTQLFYFVNLFHDWLAQAPIGFTAASRNFEDADRVLAEADDFSGFNNANMSTPTDGRSPRMQMYLFRTVGGARYPAVNSGDEADIVYHEYTHGLSHRLVAGGVANLSQKQSRAMGEGWSDFYAFDYLVAQGLVADTPGVDGDVVVGAYATGNTVTGIRREALDCPVGGTIPACDGTGYSGIGGFTYADLGRVNGYGGGLPRFEVHDDGEIWSQTLWDLRSALGAVTARGLITNAMRLTVMPNPTFLDARDAILQADLATGGTNRAALWQIFAVRGMGYGASTTNAGSTHAIASFSPPRLVGLRSSAVGDAAPFGDADGIAEPGEAIQLAVQLENPALIPLTNVRARLTSTTSGVFAGVEDATYGTIPAGGAAFASAPFVVALPAALQCGSQVAFSLQVTSDQGTIFVPFGRVLGDGRATFASANVPLAIPDAAPGGGAVSDLTVPTPGRVEALRVSIGIAHTAVGQLRARLTAPSGAVLDLFERPGVASDGTSSNNLNVTLDDGASSSIQLLPDAVSSASLAPSGFFKPNEPLALFAGQERAGTWRLRVTDAVGIDDGVFDTGSLTSWSIDTEQAACAAGRPLPGVETGAASAMTPTTATVAAAIDPAGTATQVAVEYGTTGAFGTRTAVVATGGAASFALGGLAPRTVYYYRALALRNGVVLARGQLRAFATTAPPTAAPEELQPPDLARPKARQRPVLTSKTKRAVLNRRNRFTYRSTIRPATAARVRFTLPGARPRAVRRRRGRTLQARTPALAFGATRLRAGATSVLVTVTGRALRRLRKVRKASVTATFTLAGRSVTATFRLRMPDRRGGARRGGSRRGAARRGAARRGAARRRR